MKICKECRWCWSTRAGHVSGWHCGCPSNEMHPQTGNPRLLLCVKKNPSGNCPDWETKPPKRSLWQWLTRQG